MRSALSIAVVCVCLCAAAPSPVVAQVAPVKPAPAPAPAPVSKEAASAAPTEQQVAEAREAYATGQTLFAEGRYQEARAAFERAYAAVPNPVVLVSIGESALKLGQLDDAVDIFKRYLRDRPDAPDRAEVEQKIADAEAIPATLVLSTTPAGAAIELDGKPTGRVTPTDLEVGRGEHALTLTLEGHRPFSDKLVAKLGARHELHVELEPEAAPEPEPVAEVPAAELEVSAPEGPPTTALWVTGVVGAAGLISGTVLGFMALSERSDFDANPTAKSADRGERLALFADVAFGVGAMAIITGAVLYLTSDEDAAPQTDTSAARLRLYPSLAPDAAGVTADLRF